MIASAGALLAALAVAQAASNGPALPAVAPDTTSPAVTAAPDRSFRVGGDARGGLMLLDSSGGGLVNPQWAWGARATAELVGLLPRKLSRYSLLVDLGWSFAATKSGTPLLFVDTSYHYVTIAPAWGIPVWRALTALLQLGGGFAVQSSVLGGGAATVSSRSLAPVLQYGVGLRWQPELAFTKPLRLSVRFDVTRFRRGYMDDTLIAGSVGVSN